MGKAAQSPVSAMITKCLDPIAMLFLLERQLRALVFKQTENTTGELVGLSTNCFWFVNVLASKIPYPLLPETYSHHSINPRAQERALVIKQNTAFATKYEDRNSCRKEHSLKHGTSFLRDMFICLYHISAWILRLYELHYSKDVIYSKV